MTRDRKYLVDLTSKETKETYLNGRRNTSKQYHKTRKIVHTRKHIHKVNTKGIYIGEIGKLNFCKKFGHKFAKLTLLPFKIKNTTISLCIFLGVQ